MIHRSTLIATPAVVYLGDCMSNIVEQDLAYVDLRDSKEHLSSITDDGVSYLENNYQQNPSIIMKEKVVLRRGRAPERDHRR